MIHGRNIPKVAENRRSTPSHNLGVIPAWSPAGLFNKRRELNRNMLGQAPNKLSHAIYCGKFDTETNNYADMIEHARVKKFDSSMVRSFEYATCQLHWCVRLVSLCCTIKLFFFLVADSPRGRSLPPLSSV
uniref:(northern house mosquito) hypothetical protein n=1 Tax=Culex pipiens TaxID=7175 RepID=A0A8D8JEW1_CULPI